MASWVTGAPTRIEKRSFKVERVRNVNFKGYNGPKELLKAYRKYYMPIPPALLDAIRNQGKNNTLPTTGNVTLPANGNNTVPANGNITLPATGNSTETANKGLWRGSRPWVYPPWTVSCGNPGGIDSSASSSSSVGIVPATPEQGDIEYLSPVVIGGQTVHLDFDTGSSDLWVFNRQLDPSITQGHRIYDPAQSRTFQLLQGATFSISYGDGSFANGNVGIDAVDIGGAMVPNQAIELATNVSEAFVQDAANDGLLGLAFSKLNTVRPQQQKTFFDNVMPILAEPLFTADLRAGAVGAYEFGRIDASKFTGEMAWIPVDSSQGFWQFGTAGFSVGTGPFQPVPLGQAIADTGTTLMVVSPEIAEGYYGQVPGARNDPDVGGFTVPCDAQLPDLFVDVNGVYGAKVRGEHINFARVSGNSKSHSF